MTDIYVTMCKFLQQCVNVHVGAMCNVTLLQYNILMLYIYHIIYTHTDRRFYNYDKIQIFQRLWTNYVIYISYNIYTHWQRRFYNYDTIEIFQRLWTNYATCGHLFITNFFCNLNALLKSLHPLYYKSKIVFFSLF